MGPEELSKKLGSLHQRLNLGRQPGEKKPERGRLAVLAAAFGVPVVAVNAPDFFLRNLPGANTLKGEGGHETEEHHEAPSWINDVSAGVVLGEFIGVIGGMLAGKLEFNSRTAGLIMATEAGRIALLNALGNESDHHAAEHEFNEIKLGVPIALALTELAHSTLQIEFNFEHFLPERNHIETPDHDRGDLEEWETYAADLDQKLKEEVTTLVGMPVILGATLTPYASSSFYSQNSYRVLETLYERDIAYQLSDFKRKGELFNIEEVRENAKKKAEKVMNAFTGVVNTGITGSANGNGLAFIGDPPHAWFGPENPVEWLEISSLGIGYSETYSLLMAQAILSNAGAGMNLKETAEYFIESQKRGIGVIRETLETHDLRGEAFGGNDRVAQIHHILTRLGVDASAQDELLSYIVQEDQPAFRWDLKKIVGDQLDKMPGILESAVLKLTRNSRIQENLRDADEELSGENFTEEFMARIFGSMGEEISETDSEEAYITGKNILEALSNGNIREAAIYMKRLNKVVKASQKSNLAALFGDLQTTADERPESGLDDDTVFAQESIIFEGLETIKIDPEMKRAKIAAVRSFASEIIGSITGKPDKNTLLQIALLKSDDFPGLLESMGGLDHNDIKEALEISDHEAEPNGHEEGIFDHRAQEILFALLTQIPAVGSLIHYSGKMLNLLVSDELPRLEKIKKKKDLILNLGTAISMFADNVAAYLYIKDSLKKLYEEEYGPEILTQFPDLLKAASKGGIVTAIAGGSAAKTGNGPNFMHEVPFIQEILADGRIVIGKKKLPMGKSLMNPMSYAFIGAMRGYSNWQIDRVLNIVEESVQNAA